MESNEDGDLIDLGNDGCVPRVTVDDPTPEEQEHLLDVCPPKLEQKLSLTKRQERVLEGGDKGDILVTLGHDQVVPIRKRIDVVSSDTIKRVRDITRNLEPVIRKTCSGINEETQQDTAAKSSDCERRRSPTAKHEDETYEAREISNAFDFLTEHDDHEDQAGTSAGRRNNDRAVAPSTRPFVEVDTVDYPFESSSSGASSEAAADVDGRRDAVNNRRDVQLDNLAFESSPNSSDRDSRFNEKFVPIDREARVRVGFKRRGQEDVAFERVAKRRSSRDKSHRKSWTEETCFKSAPADGPPSRIDRSASLEDYSCSLSVLDADRGVSGFLTRYEPHFPSFLARARFSRRASGRIARGAREGKRRVVCSTI